MIKEAILKVYKHQDLTYEEAYQTMDEIMSGEASEVQMSAYLTAMSMKGVLQSLFFYFDFSTFF